MAATTLATVYDPTTYRYPRRTIWPDSAALVVCGRQEDPKHLWDECDVCTRANHPSVYDVNRLWIDSGRDSVAFPGPDAPSLPKGLKWYLSECSYCHEDADCFAIIGGVKVRLFCCVHAEGRMKKIAKSIDVVWRSFDPTHLNAPWGTRSTRPRLWSNLPHDVSCLVLVHADTLTRGAMRLVCRDWRDMVYPERVHNDLFTATMYQSKFAVLDAVLGRRLGRSPSIYVKAADAVVTSSNPAGVHWLLTRTFVGKAMDNLIPMAMTPKDLTTKALEKGNLVVLEVLLPYLMDNTSALFWEAVYGCPDVSVLRWVCDRGLIDPATTTAPPDVELTPGGISTIFQTTPERFKSSLVCLSAYPFPPTFWTTWVHAMSEPKAVDGTRNDYHLGALLRFAAMIACHAKKPVKDLCDGLWTRERKSGPGSPWGKIHDEMRPLCKCNKMEDDPRVIAAELRGGSWRKRMKAKAREAKKRALEPIEADAKKKHPRVDSAADKDEYSLCNCCGIKGHHQNNVVIGGDDDEAVEELFRGKDNNNDIDVEYDDDNPYAGDDMNFGAVMGHYLSPPPPAESRNAYYRTLQEGPDRVNNRFLDNPNAPWKRTGHDPLPSSGMVIGRPVGNRSSWAWKKADTKKG